MHRLGFSRNCRAENHTRGSVHDVFCVLNVPWLFMCMYVSVWCKTEELRYCIPPWSPDSHMQHSLFLRKPDNFQSGLSPCDFVGSCVPSAVVVWVIHFDRANPAHSFKTGLMNQSLWKCVVVWWEHKWLFYMQLTHVWDSRVYVMSISVFYVQAPCFIELVSNLLLHENCIIWFTTPLLPPCCTGSDISRTDWQV